MGCGCSSQINRMEPSEHKYKSLGGDAESITSTKQFKFNNGHDVHSCHCSLFLRNKTFILSCIANFKLKDIEFFLSDLSEECHSVKKIDLEEYDTAIHNIFELMRKNEASVSSVSTTNKTKYFLTFSPTTPTSSSLIFHLHEYDFLKGLQAMSRQFYVDLLKYLKQYNESTQTCPSIVKPIDHEHSHSDRETVCTPTEAESFDTPNGIVPAVRQRSNSETFATMRARVTKEEFAFLQNFHGKQTTSEGNDKEESFWTEEYNSSTSDSSMTLPMVLKGLIELKSQLFVRRDCYNMVDQLQSMINAILTDSKGSKDQGTTTVDLSVVENIQQNKSQKKNRLRQITNALRATDYIRRTMMARRKSILEEDDEYKNLWDSVETWSFDIFKLSKLTLGRPLSSLILWAFEKYDLISHFGISKEKLTALSQYVESNYGNNPYHCCIHAADILQVLLYLLGVTSLPSYLLKEEILALFVGAALHDFKHLGLNNTYLIKTRHQLAIRYNDRSILENYHLCCAFEILHEPQYDILSTLTQEQYKSVRSMIIELVLVTDLAEHNSLLNRFEAIVGAKHGLSLKSAKDRLLLMQMCLKFADVSNCFRPLRLYLPWVKRVQEEFFLQGDKEKQNPTAFPEVSPFCNRDQCNIPKCQISFINYIAMKLLNVFTMYFTDLKPTLAKNVERNLKFWEKNESNVKDLSGIDELMKNQYEAIGYKYNELHFNKKPTSASNLISTSNSNAPQNVDGASSSTLPIDESSMSFSSSSDSGTEQLPQRSSTDKEPE